ncbi:hypothetical protein QP866_09960 [Corynebacterium imitans]|uniref:hypothetical protein n=1 Tax=Corynebacterium imitans TaxID=156978 RepID=UPI00254C974F|nr:hypothetical protein [Corynebacterium imitans]MDK8306742.1 hypothetical protein [Corynebacterium imitans]MDK8638141.1 hypothetical protein [Corynebacterium imitans]MDK8773217.1 hypothetical protein [Corynebacterium imitans]
MRKEDASTGSFAGMTSREKILNLIWLLALSIPALGLSYSCIVDAESSVGYALGILTDALVFGALIYFVPKYNRRTPKKFMNNSFPILFVAHIPSVIGYFNDGISIASLIYPIILYFTLASNERLHKWAQEPGG